VCVLAGVIHTFSNQSESPVGTLNLDTPSGWEHYMRDLSKAAKTGRSPPR